LELLKKLGYNVFEKSHQPVSEIGLIEKPALLTRIFHRLRLHRDSVGVNKWLLSIVRTEVGIQLVWIDGATNIYPWVLARLKRANSNVVLIFLSEDDIIAKHNTSYWFKFGLHSYDHIFTTKQFNIDELNLIGARNVHLVSDSYCKEIHHPCHLTSKEKNIYLADVSAIGAYEEDRYSSLLYIAKKGIKVSVWGGGWDAYVNKHCNLDIKGSYLYGDKYSKAISGSKINLNFLRKMNRDTITSRSIEIPAGGGFMLAERTERHRELFIEGKEAEYFSSDDELLDKVKYYLTHNDKRIEIASNGHTKCLDKKLSMNDVVSEIITKSIFIND
jgi:spore maturation protein CgeB